MKQRRRRGRGRIGRLEGLSAGEFEAAENLKVLLALVRRMRKVPLRMRKFSVPTTTTLNLRTRRRSERTRQARLFRCATIQY
jgi:hypothetical protein